jgi:adenosylcobinamide-GDP ribazoletransferase
VGLVALTGGLHLDGLADTADGLLSGKERRTKLAIMEQSQIGTFGALAVLCSLLLKIAFLSEIPAPARGRGLILALALGRWAMVSAAMFFPLARDRGMAWALKAHFRGMDYAFATVTTLVLTVLLLPPWGLAVCGIVWLAALVLGWAMTRVLGGLTGDTYGATCELAEVLALGVLSLMAGRGG